MAPLFHTCCTAISPHTLFNAIVKHNLWLSSGELAPDDLPVLAEKQLDDQYDDESMTQ